ncbi:hypothetical protein [Marinicella marina]|uniref:hypothetical protein n=1 Tax=Marinicella marina TaxID=2996016 RepID=UPI0024BC896D|nr:hypothetical protein [Marinicella marina]MDJ1138746.1 hypothetical protein [Marinicella marina]
MDFSKKYIVKSRFIDKLHQAAIFTNVAEKVIESLNSAGKVYFKVEGILPVFELKEFYSSKELYLSGYFSFKKELTDLGHISNSGMIIKPTPEFKVNGEKYSGELLIEDLKDIVDILDFNFYTDDKFEGHDEYNQFFNNLHCLNFQMLSEVSLFYKISDINKILNKFGISDITFSEKNKLNENKNEFTVSDSETKPTRGERNLKLALFAMANLLSEKDVSYRHKSSNNINVTNIAKDVAEYLTANKDDFVIPPRIKEGYFATEYGKLKKEISNYIEDSLSEISDEI